MVEIPKSEQFAFAFFFFCWGLFLVLNAARGFGSSRLSGWLSDHSWGLSCLAIPIIAGIGFLSVMSPYVVGLLPGTISTQLREIEAKPTPMIAPQSAAADTGAAKAPVEDISLRPFLRQYSARQTFAAASAFHIIVCAAALALSTFAMFNMIAPDGPEPGELRRLRWLRSVGMMSISLAAGIAIAAALQKPDDTYKAFIEDVLRAADCKPAIYPWNTLATANCTNIAGQNVSIPATATVFHSVGLKSTVHVNTIIGVASAFFGLLCLVRVSRWTGEAEAFKSLQEGAAILRLLLGAMSAVFVTSVFASKAFLEVPPALVEPPGDAALKGILGAMLNYWSAGYSFALITAFAPAFAIWLVKRDQFRALSNDHPIKLALAQTEDPDSAKALDILPWSTVTSILSILAPLIASPVFDVLQKLMGAATGAK